MEYKNYELDNFDSDIRYDFNLSVEELFEISKLFNNLDTENQEKAIEYSEFGQEIVELTPELIDFNKILDEKYGVTLDDFVYVLNLFNELSDEAKSEAQETHGVLEQL